MSAAIDDRSYRQALYASAMAYIGQGIAVIPLGPVVYLPTGKKSIKPLIQWEKKPEQLVTRPDQVEKWFGGFGGAQGLAIATGPSGLTMIDSDSHKAGIEERDPPAGAWVEHHAGRGGWHAYLLNPTGARNTAGAVAAGLDTRGVGGLSVAAPTRCSHPDGSVTQWLTAAPFAALSRAALADAPAELLAGRRRAPIALAGEVTEITPERAAAAVAQQREAWLTCVRGSRHNTMLEYLGALARFEMASGTPVSDMYGTLEVAVLEHPDAVAGEDFESAPAAIETAVRYAVERPWRLAEATGFEARFSADPPDAPAGGADESAFAFITGDEFDTPVEPPEATYGAFGGKLPLFYADGVHWLQGESESGKSWVALAVVIEVVRAGETAMVVDYEDTRANVLSRLRALGMTREEATRLVYVDPDKVSFSELREHLESTERQYGVMVVDGVTSSLTAAGLSGRDEQEVTRWVDRLPRRARMSVCIDHVVKAIDDRRGMAIGSQAKKAVVTGTAWEVVATAAFGRGLSGVVELRIQKDKQGGVRGRLGARKAVRLAFTSDRETGAVRLAIGEDTTAGFFGDPNDALFSALFADGVDGGVSAIELWRSAKDRKSGYSTNRKADMHRKWLEYYAARHSSPPDLL